MANLILIQQADLKLFYLSTFTLLPILDA